jgi:hypothetical protein
MDTKPEKADTLTVFVFLACLFGLPGFTGLR